MVVVCASPDRGSLSDLKRAAVGAAWELAPGATTAEDALAQLEDHHAQVLVVQGPLPGLVAEARKRHPAVRVIVVGRNDGEEDPDVIVDSLEAVRDAIPDRPPLRAPPAERGRGPSGG